MPWERRRKGCGRLLTTRSRQSNPEELDRTRRNRCTVPSSDNDSGSNAHDASRGEWDGTRAQVRSPAPKPPRLHGDGRRGAAADSLHEAGGSDRQSLCASMRIGLHRVRGRVVPGRGRSIRRKNGRRGAGRRRYGTNREGSLKVCARNRPGRSGSVVSTNARVGRTMAREADHHGCA